MVTFTFADPERTLDGQADGTIDVTYFQIMDALRRALLGGPVNYVNANLARS